MSRLHPALHVVTWGAVVLVGITSLLVWLLDDTAAPLAISRALPHNSEGDQLTLSAMGAVPELLGLLGVASALAVIGIALGGLRARGRG